MVLKYVLVTYWFIVSYDSANEQKQLKEPSCNKEADF